MSPDKNNYITGSVDKSCKLWDLRENSPKQTFFGHTADVNSVAVNDCILFSLMKQLILMLSFGFSIILVVKHLPLLPKIKVLGYSIFVQINRLPVTLHQIPTLALQLAVYCNIFPYLIILLLLIINSLNLFCSNVLQWSIHFLWF